MSENRPGKQWSEDKASSMPPGYLDKGYLDPKGNIYPELLEQVAREVAGKLKAIANNQLRRFFHNLRQIEWRLTYLKAFKVVDDAYELVSSEVQKLKVISAYQASRQRQWKPLHKFIEKNVSKTTTERELLKGFIPHFEAVVAYHSLQTEKRGG